MYGTCAAGFEVVREEFERNFAERGDVGASVAVTVDGEFVVDLWGGDADEVGSRPWERDTVVNVYSAGKGMVALCAHVLADRGELDLDAPVAKYWPEFAQAGKQNLPVRWLLSHRAGLIGPRERMARGDVYDWDRVCATLAASEPWWEPGTAQGYHAITFGFLVGEVVRRITGDSLGTFLRTEIAEPLGADLFIGTPAEEHARCADVIGQVQPSKMGPGTLTPPRELSDNPMAAFLVAFTYIPADDVNSARWRAAEVPGINAHANAHGLATVYGALATGGLVGGDTLETMRSQQSQPNELDLVISSMAGSGPPFTWGTGYQLNGFGLLGPNHATFGHLGAGGSYACADPENRMSYAYAMNKLSADPQSDQRNNKLLQAVYSAIGA
ncbi:serine hydrolase domain-containing protein [Nocardia sp. NPDC101769]|uniref:serine hydrolase domain-containing protein n=1 Tax=Nocardia sp. NPDC101769 TaxID=3364333 RepID=UPI0037F4D06B